MIEAYKRYLKNYANFNGRSTRSDYWYVVLVNILISFILGFVSFFIPDLAGFLSIITMLYSLTILVPSLAICVRRLHDINKSGWYYLLALIPIVGSIIVIVFFCTASVDENNKYGSRV